MFEDTPENRVAALIIQHAIRRYHHRKNLTCNFTKVGKGIISANISMVKPSLLFGDAGVPLDVNKLHEVMVTRVKLSKVSLVLSTNQGTPDALMKHLKDSEASYGAVINGGFYAINGFYHLGTDHPIGLHRFTYNASIGHRKDMIKKDVDNTHEYFKYTNKDLSKPFEEYEFTTIPSQLHLKTQTPDSVKEFYGCFRITHNGMVDIGRYTDFANNKAFKKYLTGAEYLLSSGPVLVCDNQVTLTKEDIAKDPRFHFKAIHDKFGSHPGSVPPGSFYHGDQLNPRSGIGVTANGDLLMVTVKGEEEPAKRDGMTLDQFALLMKLLGSKTALNLDGGYSACQGVFNKQAMITPQFVKKVGREKVLPCAIVAKEKTTVTKSYSQTETKVNIDKTIDKTTRKLKFDL